jgi:DNA gyrase/topoisomerase IV subunit A
LANPSKIYGLIKEELVALKEKYGDERKTRIVKTSLEKFSDKT